MELRSGEYNGRNKSAAQRTGQTRIHRYGQVVCRGEGTAHESADIFLFAAGRARCSPSFFPSHRQFVQRVPDAMPGDLKMPRPFLLRHIVMLFNMAAQRFPVQLAGIMAMNNRQKSWRYAATAHRYPIGYGVPILIWVLDSRNQL